ADRVDTQSPAITSSTSAAPTPPPVSPPVTSSRVAAAPTGAPVVSWDAPGQVNTGQTFDVTVRFAGGDDMNSVRSQLHYATSVLQLASAAAAAIAPADSGTPRLNQIAGIVQYVVNASTEKPARGEGSLIVLHFKALTPNSGTRISLQTAAVAT